MKAMLSFVRLSPRCGSDDQGIHVQHRLCDDMVDVEVEVDCPHCGGRVNLGTNGANIVCVFETIAFAAPVPKYAWPLYFPERYA